MKITSFRCCLLTFAGLTSLYSAQAKPARHHKPASVPKPAARQAAPALVFVTNSTGSNSNRLNSTISQYRIGEDGGLVTIGAFSIPAEFDAEHAAMDPTGHFLYVTQPEAGDIICYKTTPNGSLTPEGSTTMHVEGRPQSISFDPHGRYAYVKDCQLQYHRWDAAHRFGEGPYSRIWQYRIASDGSLTPLSPAFAEAEGEGPNQFSFTQNGQFAYLGQQGGLSQYRVNVDGTLTPLSPAFVSGSSQSYHFDLDTHSNHIYVPDLQQYHRIRRYSIKDDEGLTALPDIPMPNWYSGENVNIDPTGKFVYIGRYSDEKEIVPGKQYPIYHYYLYQYRVAPDGTFLPLNPPRVEMVFGGCTMGFAPDGQFMYCVSGFDKINQYRIQSDGTLQLLTAGVIPPPYYSDHSIIVVRRSSNPAH